MWIVIGLYLYVKKKFFLYRLQDFQRFSVVKWRIVVILIVLEKSLNYDRGKKQKREDGVNRYKKVNLVRFFGYMKEGF